jgi:hypothetical protein
MKRIEIDQKKDYYESLKEKQIKRKQMILLDDEDDKPNRKKIRLRDSKKKRQREKEQDEIERAKEKHEADQLRRERERRESEEEKRREQEREIQQKVQIKSEPHMSSPSQNSYIEEKKPTVPFSVSLNITPMNGPKKTTAPNTAPSAIFTAVEDDETNEYNLKKKRKLMPLEHEVGNHEPKEVPQESNPILDAKAKAQQVIDKIPTERAELFKFDIDWPLVDEHNIIELKMKTWVKKKIIEYLGEEESTLIDYICKKLSEHTAPDILLELLLLVLEDEASDFVIRMWRMLIYNILMIQTEQ